jgi:hypothetical protein
MAGKANHRGFGHVRKLPSKRYQGSYIGPDSARQDVPQTAEPARSTLRAEGLTVALKTRLRTVVGILWSCPGEVSGGLVFHPL